MKLKSIRKIISNSKLYDLQTSSRNFLANGIVVHNSMVFPIRINRTLYFKTKKTFESDVAKSVKEFMFDQDNIQTLCNFLLDRGFTPIFEWTSPDSKIVIDYGCEQKLTLLSARRMNDGVYFNYDSLCMIAAQYNVDVIPRIDKVSNLDALIEKCKTEEGIEGYVIYCENQLGHIKVKLKTDWYYRNHRISTDLRIRDVAEMIVDEQFDDCLRHINELGYDAEKVLSIEREVVHELGQIRTHVEELVKNLDNRDPAYVAKLYKGNQYFSLIMRELRGQVVEYVTFWKRNCLKNYSLRCVYNKNF